MLKWKIHRTLTRVVGTLIAALLVFALEAKRRRRQLFMNLHHLCRSRGPIQGSLRARLPDLVRAAGFGGLG